MNGFDLSTVTNIYLGSTPVTEVYMGSTLIWPKDTFDYATEYFTIESLEDGNQIGIVDSDRPSIEISTNKYEWTTVTPDATPTYFITLNAGEKVYIRGSNNAYYDSSWSTEGYFTSTGQFNVSGNIMSLVYGDDFNRWRYELSSNVFTKLFYNANGLISAEHLVFINDTSYGCYEYMFGYCSSLTKAPKLPATKFSYDNCYKGMFYGCSSLTKAPKLPATSLTQSCYENMFAYCSSLTTAPFLPATELSYSCYSGMFKGCSSLTTAPELPATKLYNECYFSMFYGCKSLTTAPELPATSLAYYCYGGMFMGCTSLTKAPELPATTLTTWCYSNMFYGCKSLTTAPELLATTLPSNCYTFMFQDCTSLNYIKMLATSISSSNCMIGWVTNVAPSGTFIKDASATLPTGSDGIPDGWTVENFNDYSAEYFTIESLEDGNQIGIVDSNRPSISISTDKQTWTTVTPNAAPTYFITLNTGEKVYIKGSNNSYNDQWSEQDYFTSTGQFNVSGNAMSLVYADDFQNKTTLQSSAVFRRLFANANKLISAEHLVLPATTLNGYCYGHMFLGCTSLTKVPKLPATNLSNMCYEHMFEGCTSLTTPPELPATTLEWFCYAYMFQDCTSLTTAPELPVTTLVEYCYEHMFWGCTSLTTAPELPATTLVDYCYGWMFNGCSSLNYIKMLATDVSAYNCLAEWVDGVAPSGTFVKQASTTLPTGPSGIPEGWNVITT